MELANSKVIQNKEVIGLLGAIGLKMGEEPANLRYGKIMIYTDQDYDGFSIAGLLVNFFGKYWPELFEHKRIYKVDTPLLVAKKGKEKLYFYTNEEFDAWQSRHKSIAGWEIDYKKGLASLEDDEYKEIIRNPRCYAMTKDDLFKETLTTWFGDSSLPRKEKILGNPTNDNVNKPKKG
jgi:DNA gyrase/topoisomerase IV subunit B